MRRPPLLAALVWAALSLLTELAAAQDSASAMLAARIREQGYACNRPLDAERDPALSRPDSAVWVLRCDDGRYRIRLVPDMAARIERLD